MSKPRTLMSPMKAFTLHTRPKFWPKRPIDWGIFCVTLCLMPTIYIHEMVTVYPSVWHFVPLFRMLIPLGGVFVFLNIVANFVGLVVTSTEVPQEVMSVTRPSQEWHYCDICVSYVPPRSWHCKICKVCILKRDHHCLFSGCCVGHFNCRFFIMYLFYMFIATFYCVVSDTMFLIDRVDLKSMTVIAKIAFPAFAYLSGLETLANEFYILLYIINCAALIFVSVMLKYHIVINLKGQVTNDVTESSRKYDLGMKQNVKEVLGIRWYLAWVFPFISSPLPKNGLEWESAYEWQIKCNKNFEKSR